MVKVEKKEDSKIVFPKPEEMAQRLEKEGLIDHVEAFKKIIDLCRLVNKAGGRALLVGGAVRDNFFGITPKDFDLEVYNLESAKLVDIAASIGRINDVGRSFGVLKVNFGGEVDIDVSMPRRDSKISRGHKGFKVETDSNLSIKEAASRRDFTMNALAADPLTGEVFDFYNGVSDIQNRRLVITDSEKFIEDPLRVLRGMQFCSRFHLYPDDNTRNVMRNCVSSLHELSRERFLAEWKKLLLKSESPSWGLSVGLDIGIFDKLYPELTGLKDTDQNRQWHPEGSVWTHTKMVVDSMADIVRREKLSENEAFVMMLAALCHDFGKPATTKIQEGKITSLGHDLQGQEPAENFLRKLGVDKMTLLKVSNLVTNHMKPSYLYGAEQRGQYVSDGAVRKLANKLYPATFYELSLLSEADHRGVGYLIRPYDGKGPWLLRRANKLGVVDKKPDHLISGKDLISLGFLPGQSMGRIIYLIDELRDKNDCTKEEIIDIIDLMGTIKGRRNQDLIDRLEQLMNQSKG